MGGPLLAAMIDARRHVEKAKKKQRKDGGFCELSLQLSVWQVVDCGR